MIHNELIMKIKFKNIFFLIKMAALYLILNASGIAKESNFLDKGIELFNKKHYEKSKLQFALLTGHPLLDFDQGLLLNILFLPLIDHSD